MSLHWFALAVKPRLSMAAASLLKNRGIEAFIPSYSVRRQWSDRIANVQLPLFPGYLFCRFDITDRLPILMTPGVNYILGYGKEPKAIAESDIFNIKQSLESGLALEPWPYLKAGERITVNSGPLKGVSGTVVRIHNADRLIVSVPVVEGSFTVEINPSCVAEAKRCVSRPALMGA